MTQVVLVVCGVQIGNVFNYDIEKAEIPLCCKNGEKLLGITNNKVLLNFIAQSRKFIKIGEGKTVAIPLS